MKTFDAVHIHAVFSHPCVAAAQACRKQKVPYLVRPLGSLDPWSLQQRRLRKLLFWQLAAKRMLAKAAAVHYTTAEERRLAENRLGLNHGVVVPLGTDEKLFENITSENFFLNRYPTLSDHPYAIVLCRLHPKKGLELFLELFLDVTRNNEFGNWKLVVAGDGETSYVNGLKTLVNQQRGADRILFTGWLDGSEKAAALRGASLFALPSYQENFGLSVVEAMACGVPVLVSEQVNLAAEILQANAGWVVSLEREVFRRALTEAMSNQEARASKGAAGSALVQSRFTWPAVAADLMRLYQAIAKKS